MIESQESMSSAITYLKHKFKASKYVLLSTDKYNMLPVNGEFQPMIVLRSQTGFRSSSDPRIRQGDIYGCRHRHRES